MNGQDVVAGRDVRNDVRIPAYPSFDAVRVTVAHSFPSVAQLSACRVHRTRALSQCVPISNPATGSASLTAAFESIPELAAGQRFRLQFPAMDSRMRVTKANSSHALNVGGMQTWLQRRRPKHWRRPAQCIVMTVRDPAERFESAFRDSYMRRERLVMSIPSTRRNRTKVTAALLVQHMRQALNEEESGRAPQGTANGPARLYASSAAQPDWHNRLTNYPGPTNGSLFLISQLWYLQGLNCTETELHLVCTERFESDWRRFLAAFGVASPAVAAHQHKRHDVKPHTRAHRAARNSVLSASDRAFVRDVLYPWDWELYRRACRGGLQSRVRGTPYSLKSRESRSCGLEESR